MATVGDLVRRAYRQENLIALGQPLPTAMLTEGVERFNALWFGMLGNELGEKLLAWPVPPNPAVTPAREWPLLPRDESLPSDVYTYVQQNHVILATLGGATTVYLPQNPSPGARIGLQNLGDSFATNPLTINANGRLIEGAETLTLNTATTTPLVWFYRDDLGTWVRLAALTETDDSPLPEQFDAFWRCALAMDLCPSYGKDPKAMTVKTYNTQKAMIVGRYAQTMPAATDPGNLYSMPFQSFALPGWGVQW